MNKPLILIVEDDPPIRNLISVALESHGYRALIAANAGSAILEATSHNPDIMLLDLGLPDLDGMEVIRKIRSWSGMEEGSGTRPCAALRTGTAPAGHAAAQEAAASRKRRTTGQA